MTFAEVPEDFLPFILSGQYIHVGKETSFGLARYGIVNDFGSDKFPRYVIYGRFSEPIFGG